MWIRTWFPIAVAGLVILSLPALIAFGADLTGYGPELNGWLEGRLGLSHHTALPLAAAFILFLAPLILVLLYFLKLKRKPQTVPSTFLWKKSIEDLHVNRLLQWLRKNILLLLQLLVLVAAIYAVLAPRIHGSQTAGKHYILILDNSASMSATDVKPNRLSWAKAEALKEIDAATDSDFGMVIVFNSTAEIRQSYTDNRALLRRAVEGIEPTQNPTQIDEALALASSLANPMSSSLNEAVRPENPEPGKERTYAAAEGIPAEIHIYSDGRFADVANFSTSNLTINLHAPESAGPGNADNVGIVRFDAVRDEQEPSRVQAFVRVMNFRNTPVTAAVNLDILGGGKELQQARRQPLVLDARKFVPATRNDDGTIKEAERDEPAETTIKFDLAGIDENADITLHASLAGITDAFAADDEAWVVLGVVRKARVLIVTPGNPLLDYFFDARATRAVADVVKIPPKQLTDNGDYLQPAHDGKYDLVIFDRCAPAREDDLPRSNTFFIGYPPPPWHVGGTADDYRVEPVQLPQVRGWSDADPVMRGLRGWHELEIAEAYRFKTLPPKTPRLVESDQEMLLLFPIQRGSYRDLVLAFPLATDDSKWNTRWFLKPLFPLFLRNLLYSLGNVRDAATEETVRPGSPKILRPFGDVKEIKVRSPSGHTDKLERGTRAEFSFGNTAELGVYEATWGDQTRRFAVNLFDPNESQIEPRASVKIGETQIEAGPTRRTPRELWRWAVLFGLIFILLEWWVYNRRVQV